MKRTIEVGRIMTFCVDPFALIGFAKSSIRMLALLGTEFYRSLGEVLIFTSAFGLCSELSNA